MHAYAAFDSPSVLSRTSVPKISIIAPRRFRVVFGARAHSKPYASLRHYISAHRLADVVVVVVVVVIIIKHHPCVIIGDHLVR